MNRRQFLLTASALAVPPLSGAIPGERPWRVPSLDLIPGRVADIWRSPVRFTKNPDVVRLPDNRLLLVYTDSDRHWSEEISRVATLESPDGGKSWGNPRIIAQADRRKGEELWLSPQISLLKDARILLICDHNDNLHCHEDQPPGIWLWESLDYAETFREPRLMGVQGIEPDRIIELADGTLRVGAHMTFRANRRQSEFVMRSNDGGRTWRDMAIVAQDKVHQYCEGGIVLRGGELACVMRDNLHNGYPSYVSFSEDQGRIWTKPQPLPFSGDRPYGKQLRDGRVLVTYRNINGNWGTHAWLGDLHKDIGYRPGGFHYDDELSFEGGALRIQDQPGAVTRYRLMPPENWCSDVLFEADLQVQGPQNLPIAAVEISRLGCSGRSLRLDFTPNAIWLFGGFESPGVPSTDYRYAVERILIVVRARRWQRLPC